LGWFPHGYVDDPAIEEAAFALQPDQYSQVIHTDIGYHILYLLEKDPDHPLQPDARRVLQEKAIQTWVSDYWKQSEIQILVP
jgi:peptidyl-prolyl cis-trans isomerase C